MACTFAGRCLLICPSTNAALRLDLSERRDLCFEAAPQPLGNAPLAIAGGEGKGDAPDGQGVGEVEHAAAVQVHVQHRHVVVRLAG